MVLREDLKKQAFEIEEKVLFLGAKTHEELKVIYASADIFVCPSITAKDGDQEGFGLVMLEAMASGLPVVASNSGGITQLIVDEVNGLLCKEKCVDEIADKVKNVLDNKELQNKIINNMKNTLREHDYEIISQKYIKIVEDVV